MTLKRRRRRRRRRRRMMMMMMMMMMMRRRRRRRRRRYQWVQFLVKMEQITHFVNPFNDHSSKKHSAATRP